MWDRQGMSCIHEGPFSFFRLKVDDIPDRNLSIVCLHCRHRRHHTLFTFSSYSPEPLGQFQLNLAQGFLK